MNQDDIYLLSLSRVFRVGPIHARSLLSYCGSAEAVFKESQSRLKKVPGIGEFQARQIAQFKDHVTSEKELQYCLDHGIQVRNILSANYPKRLKRIYDAPLLLFQQGPVDLDHEKIISVIGTRRCTAYGKDLVKKLLKDLSSLDILVISGLAYGIDIQAHRSAIEQDIKTLGVLAHGLDRIYPPEHKPVVEQMLEKGGLLTEFMRGTRPMRENFPSRNRIVAGLSDACIVVESAEKGGAMITAELANSYNRDVFAFPGPADSKTSKGTHKLIKQNEAILIESAEDLLFQMGWVKGKERRQTALPLSLTQTEHRVLQAFDTQSKLHIDALATSVQLNNSVLSLNLLELELKGLIRSLPGKVYEKLR